MTGGILSLSYHVARGGAVTDGITLQSGTEYVSDVGHLCPFLLE